jgi:hypothetical protein
MAERALCVAERMGHELAADEAAQRTTIAVVRLIIVGPEMARVDANTIDEAHDHRLGTAQTVVHQQLHDLNA